MAAFQQMSKQQESHSEPTEGCVLTTMTVMHRLCRRRRIPRCVDLFPLEEAEQLSGASLTVDMGCEVLSAFAFPGVCDYIRVLCLSP